MRAPTIAAVLMVSCCAAAYGFVQDQASRWWYVAPVLDFEFSGYGPSNSLLTFSRSSAVTGFDCSNPVPLIVTFGSGVLANNQCNLADSTPVGAYIGTASTNLALWGRDLTNAVWTATNITASNTTTGIDGAGNAATNLQATAANGTIFQNITAGSALMCGSAYVQRLVGSGKVYMTLDGGATYTEIDQYLTAAGVWARVPVGIGCLNETLANPQIGFEIATAGDAIAVDGVQVEAGVAVPSPVMFTTTVTVSQSADTLSARHAISSEPGFSIGIIAMLPSHPGNANEPFRNIVSVSNGSANNRIELKKGANSTVQVQTTAAGVAGPNFNTIFVPADGTQFNAVMSCDAASGCTIIAGTAPVRKSVGGTRSPIVTGAFTWPSSLNSIHIGDGGGGAGQLEGYVDRVLYWDRKLPVEQVLSALGVP